MVLQLGPDGEPLPPGEGGPPLGPDGEPLPPGEGGPAGFGPGGPVDQADHHPNKMPLQEKLLIKL